MKKFVDNSKRDRKDMPKFSHHKKEKIKAKDMRKENKNKGKIPDDE